MGRQTVDTRSAVLIPGSRRFPIAPSEQKNPAGLGGKFCWAVRWSGF